MTRPAYLLFVGLFFGLLALPVATHNGRGDPGVRAAENREPAPLPGWPRNWEESVKWPKMVDSYLADHFGRRTAMVKFFNRARFRLFGATPSEQTVFGPTGRLFLTSHSADAPYALIRFISGVTVGEGFVADAVADLTALLRQAQQEQPESYVLVAPTAPILYPEELPSWLRARWPDVSFAQRVLQRLPPELRERRLLYPLPAMAAAKQRGEVIPHDHFHWLGLGAAVAADDFAERRLGLSPRLTLALREERVNSDIAHLIPGIATSSLARVPDPSASGAHACFGAACFPEMGRIAEIVFDLSRLDSPRAGEKKLLILSDSFGAGIVEWFAPYFGSVRHFSVSNLGLLSEEERAAFRRHVFDDYRPDVVLYLFQDGSLHYWPGLARRALWGGDTARNPG